LLIAEAAQTKKKWFVQKMAFSFIHFVLWAETSWFMNAFVVINYLMLCFGSVKFVEKAKCSYDGDCQKGES
jgi:hypothetical protein